MMGLLFQPQFSSTLKVIGLPAEPEGMDTKFWIALTDAAMHPVSLSGVDTFTIFEKGIKAEENRLPEVDYTYNTSQTVETNVQEAVAAVKDALRSQVSV